MDPARGWLDRKPTATRLIYKGAQEFPGGEQWRWGIRDLVDLVSQSQYQVHTPKSNGEEARAIPKRERKKEKKGERGKAAKNHNQPSL